MSKEALRLADALDAIWIANCIGNNDGHDAAAELRRLSEQVQALEADAARYRWLRSDDIAVPHNQREIYVVMDPLPNREDQRREVLTESALDAAVDAAIAKEQT